MHEPKRKLTFKLFPPMGMKNRMKNFSAHIPLLLDKKNFLIQTADTIEELRAAQKLRHDVFLEEMLKKKKKSGLDVDRFDKRCDHLLIIDKRNGMLIGTYRLQSSLHNKKWYTATEFHMRQIKKLPGNKLELGRACVHPNYRNGITIALLWEGIHAYMLASQTMYMFGCSSIKTMDRKEIDSIYYYLKHHGHIADDLKVRPKGKFKVPGMKRHVRRYPTHFGNYEHALYKDKIPTLLQSYLKVGAKICGIPALDKSFKCVDFLTLLHVKDIEKAYTRKMNQE
ncbi:MAG: GNAT family N-acyltransferase [Candidatus Cloacimonadaceae bacterium]|nr:GNAT family N-acyltransferase [Candidatus Cloacimonadaceae bacterium]MDP3114584.1 GNAT family N-acyltransferase [Candidatus Cloacimonadaceae bacterium]